MANQMLSVGRTIWDWVIPLDLATLNPFDKVKDFDIPDRGHVPWPTRVIEHVRAHAWPDIVRMVRLGIMTCQRGSDMIRMDPEHREGNGIWCRPKKTRKRRRAFQSGTTGNRRNIGSRKKRRLHRPCLRRQTSRAGPGGAGTPDAGSPDNFYHQAYAYL